MEASTRTVVTPLRYSRSNMLHFLCGAVATQRLAVAMEHEQTCLRARADNNRTTTGLRLPFQASATSRI
jgi:hypothetical protein